MSIVLTEQYRPVTANERADGDALSVRHGVDTLHNVNNLKAYVTAPILVPGQTWLLGDRAFPAAPTALNGISAPAVNTTAEYYVAQWPLVSVPHGFGRLRVGVNGRMTVGTSCTLRLYAMARPYSGGATIDEAEIPDFYEVGSMTVNAATDAWYTANIGPGGRPAPPGLAPVNLEQEFPCGLLLTVQVGTGTWRVRLNTMTVWCDGATIWTGA